MGEPVPTWAAAAREAAALDPLDRAILETAGMLPLVPVKCVAAVSGASSVATVYRRIARLRRRGLVAMVYGPRCGNGPPTGLLLLTNLGLAVVSCHLGLEAVAFARRWRLHRPGIEALLRELPAALASYELLALVATRLGHGTRLKEWSRPWRWTPARETSRGGRPISLPAFAALGRTVPGWHRAAQSYVLVPDTGGLPPGALRAQFIRLDRALTSTGQDRPGLVVATTSARRVHAWWIAVEGGGSHRTGARIEAQVATWEAWRSGEVPLPSAGSARAVAGSERAPACPSPHDRRAWVQLPRPISVERAHAGVAAWNVGAGDRAVLDLVGRHPFLPSANVAKLLGRTARWVRERRSKLVSRGLLRIVHSDELPRDVLANSELLEATGRGLLVLAGSLGVSLGAAVRHHGLAGGGPNAPIGGRAALARRLAHTLGADSVFGVIAQAARNHRGALLEWRNAATCAHGRVRPDGYGLLRFGRREYGFFLEFDRGTVRPQALRAKFAAYRRYQASPSARQEYHGFPTILVVTNGPAAEERLACAIGATGVEQVRSLDVLLTTIGQIDAHEQGIFGSIWRTAESGQGRSWPTGIAAVPSSRPAMSPGLHGPAL